MHITDFHLIGIRLAEYREDLGWSQEEAAEASHLSLRHYQRIENGFKRVSFSTMLNICNALHISFDELLQDDKPPITHDKRVQEYIEKCSLRDLKTLSRYIRYRIWLNK